MRTLFSKITEFHPSVWRYNFGIAFVVFSLFAFIAFFVRVDPASAATYVDWNGSLEGYATQTGSTNSRNIGDFNNSATIVYVHLFISEPATITCYLGTLGGDYSHARTRYVETAGLVSFSLAHYNSDIHPVDYLQCNSQVGNYGIVGVNASNIVFTALTNSSTPPPLPLVCGNDVVEDGEQCDDGNLDDDDGCSSSCAYDLDLTAPVITLPDLEDGFLSSDFFLAYSQTPQSAVFLGENFDLSFNDFTWDFSVFHSPDDVTYTTIKNSLDLPSSLTSFTPQYVGSTFDYLPLVGADDDYYYVVARWCVDSLGVCSDIGVSGTFQWDNDGQHIVPPPASDGSDFDRFEDSLTYLPDKPVDGSITDYIVWVFEWFYVAFFGSKEAWLAVFSEYRDSFASVFSSLGDLPPAYWVMQPITSVRSGMASPVACDYTFGISGFDLFDVCDGVDRIPHAVWFSLVVVFWVIIGYSAMYLLVGGENSSSND